MIHQRLCRECNQIVNTEECPYCREKKRKIQIELEGGYER